MDIETAAISLTAIGVLIAFCAWRFPIHSNKLKEKPVATERTKTENQTVEIAQPSDPIEIAFEHLKSTTFDDERTKYISSLSKRIDKIELKDLTKLISIHVEDGNRVKSSRAFRGKVTKGYSQTEYRNFMDQFTFSDSKQKAAKYISES